MSDFKAKMHQNSVSAGLRSGAYSTAQTPNYNIWGAYFSKGRKGGDVKRRRERVEPTIMECLWAWARVDSLHCSRVVIRVTWPEWRHWSRRRGHTRACAYLRPAVCVLFLSSMVR